MRRDLPKPDILPAKRNRKVLGLSTMAEQLFLHRLCCPRAPCPPCDEERVQTSTSVPTVSVPRVGSGSSPGSVARQRAGCCSWGLSQESAHNLLPHGAKFPPAVQIWPPGARAALCDHQAKRKWSSPQLAENGFAVGVNMAVRMISEVKLCSSVPRLCSQGGKFLFRATVL